MTFKSAFAAARKAGKKEFTWESKSFNTELAETAKPKARPKSEAAPSPKARPVAARVEAAKGPSPKPATTPAKNVKGEPTVPPRASMRLQKSEKLEAARDRRKRGSGAYFGMVKVK